MIKEVLGKTPKFGNNCYIAENATIVGDVEAGDDCSFWFNTVVRGDVNSIRIGNTVNIQDGAILHCTYQRAATEIGDRVSIGHGAIVHGCTLKEDILVGMRAVIMDHTIVEPNVIIAAGAVVLENMHLQSGGVYAGTPAKRIKELEFQHFQELIQRISSNYVMYSSWYK